jgi:putative cardiolipin synthase
LDAQRPVGAAARRLLSGLRLLPNGVQAFDARIALARRAQRTLDLQTYVLAPDTAGRQLLRELRDAAARGVRVRLRRCHPPISSS